MSLVLTGLAIAAFHFAGPILQVVRSPAYRPANLLRKSLPSHTVMFLLGLHTAFLLFFMILPPYNLFDDHGLSIAQPGWQALQDATKSASCIRASPAYPTTSLSYTHLLATKLLEGREQRRLYAELGHEVFTCSWCRTKEEYLLAKLPQVAFWYLGELGGVTLLGALDGRRSEYVKRSSTVVAVAGVVEIAYRWMGVPLYGKLGYISDSSVYFWRSLFLLLTPILFLLVQPNPSPPSASTAQLLHLATGIRSALLNSDLVVGATTEMHQALTRNEMLRDLIVREGVEAAAESRIVRADEVFKQGTSWLHWEQFEHGVVNGRGLRMNAKVKIAFLWKRMEEVTQMFNGPGDQGSSH